MSSYDSLSVSNPFSVIHATSFSNALLDFHPTGSTPIISAFNNDPGHNSAPGTSFFRNSHAFKGSRSQKILNIITPSRHCEWADCKQFHGKGLFSRQIGWILICWSGKYLCLMCIGRIPRRNAVLNMQVAKVFGVTQLFYQFTGVSLFCE